jgi:hypothetical protein
MIVSHKGYLNVMNSSFDNCALRFLIMTKKTILAGIILEPKFR